MSEKHSMWFANLVHYVVQILRPYWRLRLEGAVDSIPKTGPFLVVSNHCSFMDPFLATGLFPRRIRYLITHNWFYRSKLWHFIFSGAGGVPVNSGNPRETIKAICRVLDEGDVAGIFPEGWISEDGKLQRFRPGLARVAARSGVPILPIAVCGSYNSLPKHWRFPRPARITIRVAEPMVFPGAPFEKLPDRDARDAFAKQIRDTIQSMLET